MIEPTSVPASVSPDEMLARNVNMLRRALQRFKDNVSLCDLDRLGTDCRALGDELTSLGGILEWVAELHEQAD